jgi:DNA mismatch repair protein MutS
MEELRTILRHSDERTLVVIDEVTKGTETVSGEAITIATIETLIKRRTSFIMSSHLHQLPETSQIQALEKLKIYHLTTSYDEVNELLIYDRKLQEGPGSSLYGILVAKSVGIDPEFIKRANHIRHENQKSLNILSTKQSRYNSKLYVDHCHLCNSKFNLESHHIDQQSQADRNGIIGYYHKDSSFNLIPLCENCHTSLHNNKLKIVQKESTNSKILQVIPE